MGKVLEQGILKQERNTKIHKKTNINKLSNSAQQFITHVIFFQIYEELDFGGFVLFSSDYGAVVLTNASTFC